MLGRRPDGYHELESLVTFADARRPGDAACRARTAGVTIGGPFASDIDGAEPAGDGAGRCCATSTPGLRLGAVELEKNLPVAAGLGGGSADAAALLRAVRAANPERADAVAWHEVAARLGADVPVCLAGGPR